MSGSASSGRTARVRRLARAGVRSVLISAAALAATSAQAQAAAAVPSAGGGWPRWGWLAAVLMVGGVGLVAQGRLRTRRASHQQGSAVARLLARGQLAEALEELGGRERVAMLAGLAEGADEGIEVEAAQAALLLRLEQQRAAVQAPIAAFERLVEQLRIGSAENKSLITMNTEAATALRIGAQEFHRSAEAAAGQANQVLAVASRGDELSGAGQGSIERSLGGLGEIRSRVEEIAARLADLAAKMASIGGIAGSVKDFADQSHVLALSATIEAARAGESGLGFAVVAAEIRKLADGEVAETKKIQKLLAELVQSSRQAMATTRDQLGRIESGLEEISSSGEAIKSLSAVIRDSGARVREIVASVTNQKDGISVLADAVTNMASMLTDMAERADSSQRALEELAQTVAQMKSAAEWRQGAHTA